MKRVALRYCGGCNPSYDRVELVANIRASAGTSIEWVASDDRSVDCVLLVSGCERACAEIDEYRAHRRKVLSLRSDRYATRSVVELLNTLGDDHDQDKA